MWENIILQFGTEIRISNLQHQELAWYLFDYKGAGVVCRAKHVPKQVPQPATESKLLRRNSWRPMPRQQKENDAVA